jgi:DNA repair protein RadC
MDKKSIKDWHEDDRPIEKLLLKGAEALSNSELLAIFIRTGNRNQTALDIAKSILNKYNNELSRLVEVNTHDLTSFKSVGTKKAASILASIELSKRIRQSRFEKKPKLENAVKIFEFISPILSPLKHEEFWAVYLNADQRLIACERIFKGGITSSSVDIKIILKKAIENLASFIVLCHNHPSGNKTESPQDIELTEKIKRACFYIDLKLSDHVIVVKDDFVSLRHEGYIKDL